MLINSLNTIRVENQVTPKRTLIILEVIIKGKGKEKNIIHMLRKPIIKIVSNKNPITTSILKKTVKATIRKTKDSKIIIKKLKNMGATMTSTKTIVIIKTSEKEVKEANFINLNIKDNQIMRVGPTRASIFLKIASSSSM